MTAELVVGALQGPLRRVVQAQLDVAGMPAVDFSVPQGEEALCGPDSVSWRVFKNPVALFVGGITAVLLELAEPRVRTGVWQHSSFRTDPLARMRRTGLAAMVTVYGPRSRAERMIAGVTRKHVAVRGTTPDGVAYQALDPTLMNWVQATASYGFLRAYHAFVEPLSQGDRDRFYGEAIAAARLYGAPGAPRSEAEQEVLFEAMLPRLEASGIVFEFLEILARTRALPGPARTLQGVLVRAAIDILPPAVRSLLTLDSGHDLSPFERRLVRAAGRWADRIPIRSAPPARACVRLGLSPDHLYLRRG
jgi:uncharacterized protein (DUF2236 family)